MFLEYNQVWIHLDSFTFVWSILLSIDRNWNGFLMAQSWANNYQAIRPSWYTFLPLSIAIIWILYRGCPTSQSYGIYLVSVFQSYISWRRHASCVDHASFHEKVLGGTCWSKLDYPFQTKYATVLRKSCMADKPISMAWVKDSSNYIANKTSVHTLAASWASIHSWALYWNATSDWHTTWSIENYLMLLTYLWPIFIIIKIFKKIN